MNRAFGLETAQAELFDYFRQRFVAFGMRCFDPPHQTLREDAVDGRGQQIIFHPHVQQSGNAAGGVVGVQGGQHQMSGQRGLDRDTRGFQIAHLADHDDVRILAHDRTQRMGEIQPDRRFGLDLVDTLDLVFDRILDGDDLHVGRIEFRQRRVQRGGLAGTGRARNQQDAVRLFQHFLELRQEFVGEAELVEIQHHGFAIEQAHHHRFAVRGWNSAHAQVELLALHAQHDATVLRQTPFRDVELGHDLDARNDCCGQIGRGRFDFLQHAIHAQPHFQAILERLDVDVGCARFDRALDDQIDQTDHRRFGGEIAQMFDIVGIGQGGFVADILDDGAHRATAAAVIALDQVGDFRSQADLQTHRAPTGQCYSLGRIRVLRIGDQQVDGVFVLADRADGVLFQEARRDLQRRRRIGAVTHRHQRQMQHLGAGFGHVPLRHHAQLGEQRRQLAARSSLRLIFLQPAHTREVDFLQSAARYERLDDAIVETVVACFLERFGYRCVHALSPRWGIAALYRSQTGGRGIFSNKSWLNTRSCRALATAAFCRLRETMPAAGTEQIPAAPEFAATGEHRRQEKRRVAVGGDAPQEDDIFVVVNSRLQSSPQAIVQLSDHSP